MEQIIKPATIGGFVRSLSGLFITKENPNGLTPKECTVLAILLTIQSRKEGGLLSFVSSDVVEELANQINSKLQIAVNYINRFKKKGVMSHNRILHPIFMKRKVIIDGTDIL